MSDRNIGATINVQANVSPAIQALDRLAKVMEDAAKAGDKATAELAAKAMANAAKIAQANNVVAESEKRLTERTKAETKERIRIGDTAVANARTLTEKARATTVRARGKADVTLENTKSANRLQEVEERETQKRRNVYAQRYNNELNAQHRIRVNAEMEMEKRYTAFYRNELSARRRMYEQDIRRKGPMSQQWQTAMNASMGRSNMMYSLAQSAAATGTTPSAQLFARVNAAAAASNANYMSSLKPAAGGGGMGGLMGVLGRFLGMGGGGSAGALLGSLAGGFGIGTGGYALARGVGATKENVDRANAYDRQEIAARNLSGSQSKLNELLREYEEAAGGAVDESTKLESVSRLLATGYAKNAQEVSRFVRATRGASLAMGRPQDYVIQETQLAISNTSFRRLDQIGLGIEEVQERIRELRQENQGMTRDVAFGISVLELMDEKYGELSSTMAGQATGLERLSVAWSDLNLEIGQIAQSPINNFAAGIGVALDLLSAKLEDQIKLMDFWILQWRKISGSSVITSAERSWIQQSDSRNMQRHAQRGQPRVIAPRFDEDQTAAIVDWSNAREAIERNSNAEVLAAQRSYAMERAGVIRQYETQIIREAEDFAKNRARAEEDYQQSIVELRRESARAEQEAVEQLSKSIARARRDHEERLADMAEDYNRQVAENLEDFNENRAEQEAEHTDRLEEIRKDGYERFEQLENDFTKQRMAAERKHKEDIENLASRLDARGIYEEQRRFAREQSERLAEREEQKREELKKLEETTADAIREYEKRQEKEQAAFDKAAGRQEAAYNRQVEKEQENYKRQVEDLELAFQEQREKTAEQEEQRLLDMAEAFEKRKTREDQDRAENLTRMATDHAAQLREMETQHGLRITQIREQAQEEREQLDTEFQTRLGELQLQTEEWYTEQEKLADEAIKKFDEWWNHINNKMTEIPGHPSDVETDYTDRDINDLTDNSESSLLALHKNYYNQKQATSPADPAWAKHHNDMVRVEKELKARGIDIPVYGASISATTAMGVTSAATPTVSSTVIGGASNSYGGATYVVQSGAVQIQAAPGQSEEALGAIVEERLIRALERAAVAYQ